ncbi:MAG: hypothetical protein P8Y02_06010 [Deinococcales bacterium]
MELTIVPLTERPELAPALFSRELSFVWPTFMRRSKTGELYFAPDRFARFRDFVLVAFDPSRPDVVLGRAMSAPFRLDPELGREGLPDAGWDEVIRWADEDARLGRETDTISALEILLHPEAAGRGFAARMVGALREHARRLGFRELVAPVRPTSKHLEPDTPIEEYAFRTRQDGLPYDPWLRVHVRAGGGLVRVAPCSMTIVGSLPEWRRWTGLPFDRSGPLTVPQALVPVHVSVQQGHAVYVEPNVWVRHPLG